MAFSISFYFCYIFYITWIKYNFGAIMCLFNCIFFLKYFLKLFRTSSKLCISIIHSFGTSCGLTMCRIWGTRCIRNTHFSMYWIFKAFAKYFLIISYLTVALKCRYCHYVDFGSSSQQVESISHAWIWTSLLVNFWSTECSRIDCHFWAQALRNLLLTFSWHSHSHVRFSSSD